MIIIAYFVLKVLSFFPPFEIRRDFIVELWVSIRISSEGGNKVKSKNEPSLMTVVALLFCVITSVAAGTGLARLAPELNGWAAASYAIIAAIFIAISVVILVQIMSSLRDA